MSEYAISFVMKNSETNAKVTRQVLQGASSLETVEGDTDLLAVLANKYQATTTDTHYNGTYYTAIITKTDTILGGANSVTQSAGVDYFTDTTDVLTTKWYQDSTQTNISQNISHPATPTAETSEAIASWQLIIRAFTNAAYNVASGITPLTANLKYTKTVAEVTVSPE